MTGINAHVGLLDYKVTIIILTWNGLEFTRKCLESLREYTPIGVNCQVIVVDNGSSDGTLEYLASQPWLSVIRNDRNLGFVRGNNIGIAAAPRNSDVLLLNNDIVILQRDWLQRLQLAAYSSEDVGIAGCRLLRSNGALLHAGTYMPTDTFRGQQIGANEKDINQYNVLREVEGVVGACMYIKRKTIEKIGGLDEAYFSYYEDTDYCLKARQAGHRIVCAGDVTLLHVENVSTRENKVNFSKIYDRSRKTFIRKWKRELLEANKGNKTGVFWHSLVSFPTGYAMSSKQIVLALEEQGVDVRLAYVYGTDFMEPLDEDPRVNAIRRKPKDLSLPQVLYSQGDNFCKNSGRYRIGYTMLEVDGLPRDWVDQANYMDEIWVPSTFNLDTFQASGVKRPIEVMPLGVSPDYFNPRVKAFKPSSRFTFLSVFEWGERKAPEVLLRAFTEEFSASDDVLLILKITNSDPGVHVQQQILDMGLRQSGAPICLLYNQRIPAYQLGSLYRSTDCLVLPTRGEGWCMPAIEAMACGLPVIVTDWSAQTDFVKEEYAYPLRVQKLIPAHAKCPYYTGFRWAEPDIEHLRFLMRYVYEHPEEAKQKGLKASTHVLENWTWNRAAARIKQRLQAVQ